MKHARTLLFGLIVGTLAGTSFGERMSTGTTDAVPAATYMYEDAVSAGKRLAENLLSDPQCMEYHASKTSREGVIPVMLVGHISNHTEKRMTGLLEVLREELENALRKSERFVLCDEAGDCDCRLMGDYRIFNIGTRVVHRVSMRLIDIPSGRVVWTDIDEIAKE